MKKEILLLTSLLISSSAFANDDLKNKMKNIGLFKAESIKIEQVLDKGSIYLVGGVNKAKEGQEMPFDAFVTKDLEVVILGKGFYTKNGEELYIPKNMDKVKEVAALTIGTGTEDYYLFTDPECPYCVELEKNINANLSEEKLKRLKIHVILFPLPFHKNAKNMSYFILSKKTNEERHEALKSIMLNRDASFMKATHTVSDIEKYNEQLEKQLNLGNQFGIQGTPTILDSNGKKINPAEIFK